MELSLLALGGRLVVGLVFIAIGVRLLVARSAVAALLGAKKLPSPRLIALAGGIIEIGLGLLAVLGIAMPYVAIAMALFVIAATLMVHDFWNLQGQRRALEVNTVLTHSLVVGGLLVLAAYPW